MTGAPERRAEGGFSLVETAISMVLVGLVMASLTSFFTITTKATRQQNNTEVATGLATSAMSRVRGIKGSSLVYGRDATSSHQQWNNPVTGVAPYLDDSTEIWDPKAAAGSGPDAALPTTPETADADGVTYQQSWYLGSCWQSDATGVCDPTKSADEVQMVRVVVAVTWADAACPAGSCGYVRSTLVSPAADPVFNTGTPYPDYASAVIADDPLFYHRLDEAPGSTVAADSSGHQRSGTHPPETGGALSGLWTMDEGAGGTAADRSAAVPAHDLTVSGTGWSGTAISGSSLSFDGTAAYAAAPAAVTTTGSFTVAAWVYLTDTTVSRTAVSQDGNTKSGFELGYSASLNRWVFGMAQRDNPGNPVDQAVSDGAPRTNTWIHLAGVYNAASTGLDLYVNGRAQAAYGLHTAANSWSATGAFTVGAGKHTVRTKYWKGLIDEVRVESSRVSGSTPASMALAFGGGAATSWQFNDNTGTGVTDESGTLNAGTLAGSAGWTTPRSGAAALSLDGSTAYASGAAAVDTTASLTVTAWVRLSAVAAGGGAVVSQNGAHSSGFALRYSGGAWRFLMARTDTAAASTDTAVSTSVPAAGAWTHLAGVWNAATGAMTVYVNGVAEGTATHTTAFKAGDGLQVGRHLLADTWTYGTAGSVDDVRLYARALHPGQVTAVFNGGVSGTTLGVPGALRGALLSSTGQAFTRPGKTSGFNQTKFTNPTTFTLECWFRTKGVSGAARGQTLFSFSSAATGNTAGPGHDRRLFLDAGGHLSFATGTATSNLAVSSATYLDGQWHHVAATSDPTAGIALYVDGVLAGSAAYTAPNDFAGYWRWGGDTWDSSWPTDYFWLGTMDEVAVYGTALPAPRIAVHYQANH